MHQRYWAKNSIKNTFNKIQTFTPILPLTPGRVTQQRLLIHSSYLNTVLSAYQVSSETDSSLESELTSTLKAFILSIETTPRYFRCDREDPLGSSITY